MGLWGGSDETGSATNVRPREVEPERIGFSTGFSFGCGFFLAGMVATALLYIASLIGLVSLFR